MRYNYMEKKKLTKKDILAILVMTIIKQIEI